MYGLGPAPIPQTLYSSHWLDVHGNMSTQTTVELEKSVLPDSPGKADRKTPNSRSGCVKPARAEGGHFNVFPPKKPQEMPAHNWLAPPAISEHLNDSTTEHVCAWARIELFAQQKTAQHSKTLNKMARIGLLAFLRTETTELIKNNRRLKHGQGLTVLDSNLHRRKFVRFQTPVDNCFWHLCV